MSSQALLLHGLSSEPSGWWRVREHLEADGWQVTAPDLLGHGGSAGSSRYALVDYVTAVLDRSGAGPWDLVIGHSLGGAVAVSAASRNSGWASRVVLVDPVLRIAPDELDGLVVDQVAELALTDHSIRIEHPLWADRDVEAKLRGVRSVIPEAVPRTFADTIVLDGAWDLRTAASSLRVPTLVLAADPGVGTMHSAELAAELGASNPLITTRVIPGAGHSVHRDRPEETLAAVSAWIA